MILVVLYLKGDPPIVKGILNASRGELAIPAAAGIRVELERRGSTIGPLDLLIAGTAVSRGAALVTNNAAEFLRVPGLRVLDWRSA